MDLAAARLPERRGTSVKPFRPVELGPEFADRAARVLRTSCDDRLPWLAGRHSPEDDGPFVRHRVFPTCAVWGVLEAEALIGFAAMRPGWIDRLYVLPTHRGRGVGASLLDVAKTGSPELPLWTFQRNHQARRFYERHGFVAVETTDGGRNEEKEPDVRYRWQRDRRVPPP